MNPNYIFKHPTVKVNLTKQNTQITYPHEIASCKTKTLNDSTSKENIDSQTRKSKTKAKTRNKMHTCWD